MHESNKSRILNQLLKICNNIHQLRSKHLVLLALTTRISCRNRHIHRILFSLSTLSGMRRRTLLCRIISPVRHVAEILKIQRMCRIFSVCAEFSACAQKIQVCAEISDCAQKIVRRKFRFARRIFSERKRCFRTPKHLFSLSFHPKLAEAHSLRKKCQIAATEPMKPACATARGRYELEEPKTSASAT